MIRNHMIDPENTPPRPTGYNNGLESEDPWFTSSPNPSPTGTGPATGTAPPPYSFNQYGYNPYPTNNTYGAPMNTSNVNHNNINNNNFSFPTEDFENELPLLEELGICSDHIIAKTQAVLFLHKQLSDHILDDADLAGPIGFCLLLGACLLLSGKVQFGYIYGVSVSGCLGLYTLISLMHPTGLDFWLTCSVLGYCLLPVIGLSVIAIVLNLRGIIGLILSIGVVIWSTIAATRLLDAKLKLTEQYWLFAYPIMLLYSCFVLLTIF